MSPVFNPRSPCAQAAAAVIAVRRARRIDSRTEVAEGSPDWYASLKDAVDAIYGIWCICGAQIYRVRLPGRNVVVPVIVWPGCAQPQLLDDPTGTPADRAAAILNRERLLGELDNVGVTLSDELLRDALALAPREDKQWVS